MRPSLALFCFCSELPFVAAAAFRALRSKKEAIANLQNPKNAACDGELEIGGRRVRDGPLAIREVWEQ